MMDLIKQAVLFVQAIEKGDWHYVENALTDDFRFFGPMPDPVGKGTYLQFQEAVKAALPDLSLHLTKVVEHDHHVNMTMNLTGTHSQELRLPLEGVRPLSATGVQIHLPSEEVKIAFESGRISEIHTSKQMHRGAFGLLEQLGIEI